MCGIAGVWLTGACAERPLSIAQRMAGRLIHRGPDANGSWESGCGQLALGFRRLAIQDLSRAGHQPMTSASHRYVICYNGEIYNFASLRDQLSDYPFRGHSDTEVLLAGFDAWGVVETCRRAVGMFALAVWDEERRELLLVRDRLGEKPLYYELVAGRLLFASELKAFSGFPGWRAEVDPQAVGELLRFNYVPGPGSIFKSVRKLDPASCLVLTERDVQRGSSETVERYWSLREVVGCGPAADRGTPARAAEIENALELSVREKMVADVPVGAFLSGGIDSSLVVALAQKQSSTPVRTFTIGFSESEYDEAPFAKAVADHLGTHHTELRVTPKEAQRVIPLLPTLYDEPFSDSSQIPTFLVSKLARSEVTVSLSGDGADEIFGGYTRYRQMRGFRRLLRWPQSLRSASAALLSLSPESLVNSVGRALGPILPSALSTGTPLGQKIARLSDILPQKDLDDVYLKLMSHWDVTPHLVVGYRNRASTLERRMASGGKLPWESTEDRFMYYDTLTYLPDDILVKVDRATMGVGLESRAPFLDHRVVELAWRLPAAARLANGRGKVVLRELLAKHVPSGLFERRKMGFGVPVERWIRKELRDWAEELLDRRKMEEDGLLNAEVVRQKWTEHVDGRQDWGHHIWDVLMFQAWHRAWQDDLCS